MQETLHYFDPIEGKYIMDCYCDMCHSEISLKHKYTFHVGVKEDYLSQHQVFNHLLPFLRTIGPNIVPFGLGTPSGVIHMQCLVYISESSLQDKFINYCLAQALAGRQRQGHMLKAIWTTD